MSGEAGLLPLKALFLANVFFLFGAPAFENCMFVSCWISSGGCCC